MYTDRYIQQSSPPKHAQTVSLPWEKGMFCLGGEIETLISPTSKLKVTPLTDTLLSKLPLQKYV